VIRFGYLGPTGLKKQVAVGQQGRVVEAGAFDVALDGAVRGDNGDAAGVGDKQSVLSASLVGKSSGCEAAQG
jgi:hypothetical protein